MLSSAHALDFCLECLACTEAGVYTCVRPECAVQVNSQTLIDEQFARSHLSSVVQCHMHMCGSGISAREIQDAH